MTELFRREVLEARQVQWLGSIRVGRPPSFAWVTGIALLFAIALMAFAAWGEVTRKTKLPGILVPVGGLITVSAPQAAVVTEVLVREGDMVSAGQALMRLKSERMTALGDAGALNAQALVQRRASLDSERLLILQQAQQRQAALTDRLRSLQAEERQALAELEGHQLRVKLAQKSQERYAELSQGGFVSAAQTQQKQEELLDLQLRERNAARNLQALQRDIQAIRGEQQSTQTNAQTSLAQLDRSIAALTQESTESDARGGLTITAPQQGQISALGLRLGQNVQAGQTLVSLVPHGTDKDGQNRSELEAQLYAPSRAAGFVKPGQTVWLRYAAYPYQKFGMAEGMVDSVSRTPIAPQDLSTAQAQTAMFSGQAGEPQYRISIQLRKQSLNAYGEAHGLKSGMTLDADVLQEKRAIWEWLLEPVLAIAKSAKGKSDSTLVDADP